MPFGVKERMPANSGARITRYAKSVYLHNRGLRAVAERDIGTRAEQFRPSWLSSARAGNRFRH